MEIEWAFFAFLVHNTRLGCGIQGGMPDLDYLLIPDRGSVNSQSGISIKSLWIN